MLCHDICGCPDIGTYRQERRKEGKKEKETVVVKRMQCISDRNGLFVDIINLCTTVVGGRFVLL